MNLIKHCEIWGFHGVKIQVEVFWIVEVKITLKLISNEPH
jgi:hypothetical protein